MTRSNSYRAPEPATTNGEPEQAPATRKVGDEEVRPDDSQYVIYKEAKIK